MWLSLRSWSKWLLLPRPLSVFPGGSCFLLCRLPAAMILSLTSVRQRLSLFSRNNKQYYTTCYFQKTLFFFNLHRWQQRKKGTGIWVSSPPLFDQILSDKYYVQITRRKKVDFLSFLAWHIQICRILHRQKKGSCVFLSISNVIWTNCIVLYCDHKILCNAPFVFYFIKGSLI